jgi:hypothetical protein
MKSFRLFSIVALVIAFSSSLAQETPASISDEELKKYAVVMDSVSKMTEQLKITITDLVRNNPKVTAARYNELSKIMNDSVKLKAANPTADELTAMKEIAATRDAETLKIQETLKTMAKEQVGSTSFNKIRSALKSDPAVKSRYDAILAGMQKERS